MEDVVANARELGDELCFAIAAERLRDHGLDGEQLRDRLVLATHLVRLARCLEEQGQLVESELAGRDSAFLARRGRVAERGAEVAPGLIVVRLVLEDAEGVADRIRGHRGMAALPQCA